MNYLSIIYKEHIKKPYCIGVWGIGVCTTCACNKIRTRIFDCIVDELKINSEETGTEKYFRGLSNIRNTKVLKKMIENLCENLNKLSVRQTRRIGKISDTSSVPRFMHNSILVFIVMEIWKSLRNIYDENEREEAIQYLLSLIQNDVVIDLIKSMDTHYRQHHFRDDPSAGQF
jgi:hypothetical protein